MISPRTIDVGDGGPEVVREVAAVLLAGRTVVLPTDTVYGLAALPGDPAATARLFAHKGRGRDTPIAVLCADAAQALGLADAAGSHRLRDVTARWWPGPLTVVVPRRPGLELHLGEPTTTVGLRVPDHGLVRAVAEHVGPIAVTSANRHGEPTPATASDAAASLLGEVALVVDGGRLGGTASTVIDATTSTWTILREGAIPGQAVVGAMDEPGGAG